MSNAFASQNGAPEERIVQSQFGTSGYVLYPLIKPTAVPETISLPYRWKYMRVPLRSLSLPLMPWLKAFPLSVAPHVAPNDYVSTETTGAAPAGAFLKGAFSASPSVAGRIGAFRHSYVDDGPKSAIVVVAVTDTDSSFPPATFTGASNATLKLYDAVSGDALSASGAITGRGNFWVWPPTWAASPDGRTVVVEFASVGTSELLKKFSLAVDYAADPVVTVTEITDSTPYGSSHEMEDTSYTSSGTFGLDLDETVANTYSSEIAATVPMTRGATDAGVVVTEIARVRTTGRTVNAHSVDSVVDSVLHRALTVSIADSVSDTLTVTLPGGGASKEFVLRETSSSMENDSHVTLHFDFSLRTIISNSYALTSSDKQGALTVLYSDPSIRVVFYKYEWILQEVTDSAGDDGQHTLDQVTTKHEEIGALLGTETVTFFTDQAVTTYSNSSFGVSFERALDWRDAPDRSTDVTTDYGVQGAFAAQMYTKLKHVRQATNVAPVVVDAKSAEDWILGSCRFGADVHGVTVNTFDVYAGRLDGALLKTRVIEYLISALTALGGQEAVIADLKAGNLAPYDIRLNDLFRLISSNFAQFNYRDSIGSFV